MRRISLVGVSGSGKSTDGRRLATSLGLPFVELDAIFHQAGWRDLPTDEFRTRVRDAVATDAWVVVATTRLSRTSCGIELKP